MAGQASYGKGWILAYHNTWYTGLRQAGGAAHGPFLLAINQGTGNFRVINNIYSARADVYTEDNQDDGSVSYAGFVPYNQWDYNAHYTDHSSPEWRWHATDYTTLAAMLSAASPTELSMTGTVSGINPFPSGFGGPLASQLQGIAVAIDGITDIAADANGDPLTAPLDLGHFPKWQS